MKKNTKKIAVLLLVAVVAVGSYFVSGTYAKYTSEFSGSGSANVAKWSWTINNKDFTTAASVSEEFTFNPFADIKDSDGNAETDVDDDLIAPGTKGEITLDITNNSEVNATYTVAYTVTNTSNVPLEFSNNGTSWTSDITSLDVSTPVNIDMNGGTATQNTIYWRWVYENGTGDTLTANDATDTALGFAANTAAPEVEIVATVTATQVD